jgi:hypothetical protein
MEESRSQVYRIILRCESEHTMDYPKKKSLAASKHAHQVRRCKIWEDRAKFAVYDDSVREDSARKVTVREDTVSKRGQQRRME